jgi:hypothetical protein
MHVGTAIAQNPDKDILSKTDARNLFAMSENQWIANVKRAVKQGLARAVGSSQGSGIGMATQSPGHVLSVRPMYLKDKSRPVSIQVVVGYRKPLAEHMNEVPCPLKLYHFLS